MKKNSIIRKIITIDAETCNGCGLCVSACHEGAIGMENGKAVLLRDDYCDGLGDCLPVCPVNAITFVEREALPYDEDAVLASMKSGGMAPRGCPGGMAKISAGGEAATSPRGDALPVRPAQWPVQIRLVAVNAPFFAEADLLVAADCSAFAYGNFHADFMAGNVTIIGCPKLDGMDYTEKLTAILAANDIKSITVARMSVPCCGGLEQAVKRAVAASGKSVSLRVAAISPDGKVL